MQIEQRGLETRAKKFYVRKSNVTTVTLVIFTTSMPTIETVETRHDKAATRHDGDGDGYDGDGDGHDGDGDDHVGDGLGAERSHFTPRS